MQLHHLAITIAPTTQPSKLTLLGCVAGHTCCYGNSFTEDVGTMLSYSTYHTVAVWVFTQHYMHEVISQHGQMHYRCVTQPHVGFMR